ncbi:hypothetical protein [Okeania sp. SIO2B3]|uniref:hypothetical protein n=1 Tax=Okeania sp. SIO2B3 TaxID=2607784 RepID=UPI0013C1B26F|nr:hypothetical protein [Okeania sp. SIO2B3]NET47092.1 hypothetical protein [Okeania sp. SIO2B3]
MNQKNTTTNNFSLDSTDTELQQCMSDSVIETSCLELGDKYSPKGQITAHPFSLSLEELSGLINYGQEKHQNIQATQAFSSKDSSFPTEYSVGKISIQLAGDSKPGGQTKLGTPKNTPLKNSSFPTDYSVGKNSIQLAEDSKPGGQTKLGTPKNTPLKNSSFPTDYSVGKISSQLAEDSKPGGQTKLGTPKNTPLKNSSFPTDYSVGKISSQLAGDSKSGGQPGFETPISIPIKDYSFPTEYSVGKSPAKPVGGSGWLHKYTSLKKTKTGLVEYPRVKEGQRSRDSSRR